MSVVEEFSGIDVDEERCISTLTGVQELCESLGGHPGLPVPNSPYGLCKRNETLRFERTTF